MSLIYIRSDNCRSCTSYSAETNENGTATKKKEREIERDNKAQHTVTVAALSANESSQKISTSTIFGRKGAISISFNLAHCK